MVISKQTKYRVIVIGGGAAGLSVTAHLLAILNDNASSLEIVLLEKNARVGPGLAYSTTSDVNLLNTPASSMGIYASNPHHFLDWLEENPLLWQPQFPGLQVDKDSTPPRRLYGLYLEHMGQALQKEALEKGISLHYYQKEIVDMEIKEAKTYLSCHDGSVMEADTVILAIGGFPASSLRHLRGLKGYFPSPFPEEDLIKNIPSTENVCVVGSRLTAIDAILTLQEAGHQGKITCVSRTGRFPCVRGHLSPYKRQFLTKEYLRKVTRGGTRPLKLNQLFAIISKEIKLAEQKPFRWKNFPQQASGKTMLRHEMTAADRQERRWQTALLGKNSLFVSIWRMLTEKDREILLKNHFIHFLIYRAAFPKENARKIYNLMKQEKLELLSGVKSIQYDSEKELFRIQFATEVLETKYLIDATGLCSNILFADNIFIKSLKNKGLIVEHHLGGIQLDPDTLNVINAQGNRCSNFYAIGAIAIGVHLATNIMEYIVQASTKVADSISKQLKERTVSHE